MQLDSSKRDMVHCQVKLVSPNTELTKGGRPFIILADFSEDE
jgi:hypothetical protein